MRRFLRRNFGRDKLYYRIIDDLFGFLPNNIELYKLALIHRSASLSMGPDHRPLNNERLEFLGDAVIEAIVTDFLYIEFPEENEGTLTRLRSRILSRKSHNALALSIGLDNYVIVDLDKATMAIQKDMYGDALEAMFGAIYLDKGFDFTNRLLINRVFVEHLDIEGMLFAETDFKSRLIEWCQKYRYKIEYKTRKSGRAGFKTTVFIDSMEMGYGQGVTKKEAEQRASWSMTHAPFSDEKAASMLDRVDMLDVLPVASVDGAESKRMRDGDPDAAPRKPLPEAGVGGGSYLATDPSGAGVAPCETEAGTLNMEEVA